MRRIVRLIMKKMINVEKIITTTIIIIVVMMNLMWWWYVWWKWCDMIIRLINWRWLRWTSFHHCGCDDAFDENNDATCRERHPAGKATSLTTPSFQDSRPSLAPEERWKVVLLKFVSIVFRVDICRDQQSCKTISAVNSPGKQCIFLQICVEVTRSGCRTKCQLCLWLAFCLSQFLVGILSGPSQHVLAFCQNHEKCHHLSEALHGL